MSIWQPVCCICTRSLMSLQCVFMVWVVVKLPRPCELANFSHLGINLLRMATLTSTMQQRKDSNKKMQPMEDGNIDIKDADASKVWFLEQQWGAWRMQSHMGKCGPYEHWQLLCVISTPMAAWCHINPWLWQQDIMDLWLFCQCVLKFSYPAPCPSPLNS